MSSEVSSIAQNLARNCGYAVFPCLENKRPATPNGFKNASKDPEETEALWRRWPGPLIGVAAGEASGVSILDVDVKHDAARAWWIKSECRLPVTRSYRTRSGGLHLLFQHAPGVRNSEGVPIKGIDTRGDGGYFISWFAAGFECLDHAPPAPWPAWLTTLFWPPPKVTTSRRRDVPNLSDKDLNRVIEVARKRVREAGEGERHNRLRSSAKLLGGIQGRARFTDDQAIGWLTDDAGVPDETKAADTVAWGLAKGREQPLELGSRR